jgi:hypothetical protein
MAHPITHLSSLNGVSGRLSFAETRGAEISDFTSRDETCEAVWSKRPGVQDGLMGAYRDLAHR